MVSKIHGQIAQGYRFSKQVKVVTIGTANGTFRTDLKAGSQPDAIDSGLEKLIRAVSSRGTVVAINVTSETTVHVMLDYANSYQTNFSHLTVGSIEEEIKNLIEETTSLTSVTVNTYGGFSGSSIANPL